MVCCRELGNSPRCVMLLLLYVSDRFYVDRARLSIEGYSGGGSSKSIRLRFTGLQVGGRSTQTSFPIVSQSRERFRHCRLLMNFSLANR